MYKKPASFSSGVPKEVSPCRAILLLWCHFLLMPAKSERALRTRHRAPVSRLSCDGVRHQQLVVVFEIVGHIRNQIIVGEGKSTVLLLQLSTHGVTTGVSQRLGSARPVSGSDPSHRGDYHPSSQEMVRSILFYPYRQNFCRFHSTNGNGVSCKNLFIAFLPGPT